MKAQGMGDLDSEALVRLRIHDVDPQFIKSVRELGFANITSEELVRV